MAGGLIGAPEWTIVDIIHRGPWWTNRGILMLNICLLLPLLTSSINGYDSSVVNGLQILPDWQSSFHHPDGKALGLINSAQNIGAFVAMPLTPIASDRLGRRAALFIGSLVMLAGVTIQCAATTIAMFVGSRFVVGFGIAFATNAAPLLITELAYPTQRAKFTSVFNSCWYMGSIAAAWACFAGLEHKDGSSWAWRIPSLVQAVGSVVQVMLVWCMPESPRWLVSQGKESKAARILAKYHAKGGDEHDPLVMFEMAQIRHALKIESECTKSSSWLSLVSTPGNRKRMRLIVAIALFSQWSGNGLVSYYINLVLDGVGVHNVGEKAKINGGLQMWNFFCAVSASLLVEKLGRRVLFLSSNAGMLIVFSMWTLTTALFNTTGNANAAKATIPLFFMFYAFYDIAYTAMLVAYTLEILPFSIRAKGFAVMNITVCLTLAFNQFVNPWALDALGWKYYLVYCGWLVFELAFIARYAIETKGRTLEETAALFDGEALPQEIVAMGGEAATMSLSRAPGYLQETEIRYEKAPAAECFELDLWRTQSSPHSIKSKRAETI